MGNLHHVYQLKPKIIYGGAILQVRKDKEIIFSGKFTVINEVQDINNILYIFENTFIINSQDGKVIKFEWYENDRIIDFGKAGIYISIQGSTKYGFDRDFNDFLSDISPYLEDTLFYVTRDETISRYEIINGTLHYRSTHDFGRWNYFIEEYVVANYSSSKQLIADLHVEETNEMIVRHKERTEYEENPNEYYDPEDYEDLLNKINNYKEYISVEKFTKLEDWLKIQINYYN
ncbi:hypothetical protein [Chryseobacterium jejuense]|uniref:Uncharacterized protein n=1 Tax=Chryseobacterium jejuense TaxID=445960 RepID=A0A2X2Z8Y8_CHRJE|nr:hypothetical protein [Chryseobacterium jejuense]SDJ57204.1 hypothetical protein SAMN05421542_3847 [Chryseobacterium jejuense]SQB46159.1 Uncharacterised protein [Chryseobacterium jejuense]